MAASITTTIPRIGVVGGGIAGTLCAWVLKQRGLAPSLLDAGQHGLGGRLRSGGCAFVKMGDPRVQSILGLLQEHGLVQPWQGRAGLLGSAGGGFLPASIVRSGVGGGGGAGGIAGLAKANPGHADDETTSACTDAGDFCAFVKGSEPTFVGTPDLVGLCPRIAELARIPVQQGVRVTGATMDANEGGWIVASEGASDQHFDGLVMATHDPTLAASLVQGIAAAELQASASAANNENDPSAALVTRLTHLSDKLLAVRSEGRRPLCVLQAEFPPGFSSRLPLDAASVPGSNLLQFLYHQGHGEHWAAVSTSAFAAHLLNQEGLSPKDRAAIATKELTAELERLVSPYFEDGGVPTPKHTFLREWGAGLCEPTLQAQEDSILLEGWRLAICGDYLRAAHAGPWESAAVSGLDAGERMAALWTPVPPETNQ